MGNTKPVLFAADVHLDASRPEITRRFRYFLRHIACHSRSLYLLGDIFESWIGDDDPSELARTIQTDLRTLATAGVRCYFMPGNRDFLLGKQWLDQASVSLLPDPAPLPDEDTPTPLKGRILLSHGDALCTDDTAYQQIRRLLRTPQWQQEFLAKPLTKRRAFAENARAQSRQYTATADEAIMDVNAQAVDTLMQTHDADILIHGHTHRPAMHRWQSASKTGWRQRLVVGDWHHQSSFLRLSGTEFRLITC